MTIWIPELASDARQVPRYRKIAESIGSAIGTGVLSPGERLPPQRQLADALAVTVGTITRAYSEAQHRGWVYSRVGSGTYVCEERSTDLSFDVHPAGQDNRMIDMSLSFAPHHVWRQQGLRDALSEICQDPDAIAMASQYQTDIGNPAHRKALAEWLEHLGFTTRGELIVTQGGQHGLDLCLRALTRPGELVAADTLTYPGFNAAVRHGWLKSAGIPLDDDGMDIEVLTRLCQRQVPRMVYITAGSEQPDRRYTE